MINFSLVYDCIFYIVLREYCTRSVLICISESITDRKVFMKKDNV